MQYLLPRQEKVLSETPKSQGMLVETSPPFIKCIHSPEAGLALGRYLTAPPQKISFPTQRKASEFSVF